MPVRSLSSSVIVWPKSDEVVKALKDWASTEVKRHSHLMAVGYFGSYSRGDWGVGSDLDVVVVFENESHPPEKNILDSQSLPVPVDFFVYTLDEWETLIKRNNRFARMLRSEAKWVYRRDDLKSPGF